MSDKDTLKIWQSVKKTDPSATKDNSTGGRKSTSINGYWMIEKATELWGPVGSAWGYEIAEEHFQQGGPIINRETGEVICNQVMHTIRIELWYPGCAKPVTQFGHTPYIYQSKYGATTDMEAPKKSLMDAIKKSLSMLGFSADVFQGEFDNQEYVAELRNEEAIKKAEDKDAERERQKLEYKQWFADTKKTIETAVSLNELEKVFKLAYLKMQRRADQKGIKEMTLAKDKRKSEIENKEQAA